MKVLIIQTAFIGDVILALPLADALKEKYPHAQIHFLLRKGNEILLQNHPNIQKVLVWNKKQGKYGNLFRLLKKIRKENYDYVFNLQRFLSSGLLTLFSRARETRGFCKNPLGNFFTRCFPHEFHRNVHETDRNLSLLQGIAPTERRRPSLFPAEENYEKARKFSAEIVLAPASEWFTKQLPEKTWRQLAEELSKNYSVTLIGAPKDEPLCESIGKGLKNVKNACGELSLLDSAALIDAAKVLVSNDSAPVHIASAMNTPTILTYCSTIPEFGFFPLAEHSEIIETKIECRPCGLHGKKECPRKHFKCGNNISAQEILEKIRKILSL